jgi:hypothetical protein
MTLSRTLWQEVVIVWTLDWCRVDNFFVTAIRIFGKLAQDIPLVLYNELKAPVFSVPFGKQEMATQPSG